MEPILPLIVSEISNTEYHHSEAWKKYYSSSQIKNYMVSPKYARYVWLNPENKESAAFDIGSVYHSILESLTNETECPYIVFKAPINSKTGKAYGFDSIAYSDAKTAFCEQNPGKEVCSEEVWKTANAMVSELRNGDSNLSPVIRTFIKNGKAEQSHFLEYQGGLFKYRTDLKTKNLIIDWKSTPLEIPKPENFERQIVDYGYYISAAMYQFFEHELTGRWKKFYWVVQEKQPPYDFTIIDAGSWTWEISTVNGEQIVEPGPGAIIFLKLLEEHLICLERNEWPGYSIFQQPDWKGRRIAQPDVPGWYKNKMFNFFHK